MDREAIEHLLKTIWSKYVNTCSCKIKLETNLNEYMIDTFKLSEYLKEICNIFLNYNIKLDIIQLSKCNNLKEMSQYIKNKHSINESN